MVRGRLILPGKFCRPNGKAVLVAARDLSALSVKHLIFNVYFSGTTLATSILKQAAFISTAVSFWRKK